MALKNDWATDDYYAASDANAVADAVNAATTNGVIMVAPPTGVAATDTTAIQDALDAVPAGGGDVLLGAGIYYLTTGGLSITTPSTRLRGVGARYGTRLRAASATATAITCDPTEDFLPISIENLFLYNDVPYTGGGSPTGGYGVQFTNTIVQMNNVAVDNFYDNVRLTDQCWAGTIQGCAISNPVRYGLFMASPTTPDGGDNNIIGNLFTCGTYTPNAGIRWESGGGLRVSHNKFNGMFDVCVDCALAASAVTVDLFIHDNSIEATSSTGNTGVKFARQTVGSGTVSEILVLSNEFMFMELCVDYGPGFSHALFDQNVAVNCDANLTVRAGAGTHTEGTNLW